MQNLDVIHKEDIYPHSSFFAETLNIISSTKEKTYERVFQKNNATGKKPLLWINNPQYYFTQTELKEDDRINSKNINVFVTGCNTECANIFAYKKFKTYKAAKEAVLKTETNHFSKKSVKELIRYGSRRGLVREIEFSHRK